MIDGQFVGIIGIERGKEGGREGEKERGKVRFESRPNFFLRLVSSHSDNRVNDR